jgi:AcrR family transcriptional regulator
MNSDRARRGPRGDISRAGILTAADRVLRAEGLSGLSLRAVAREAGITPNAVYTYVASMAELRNALGDDFLIGLDLRLLRCEAPREALQRFLEHVLQVFAQSPHHVAILASQPVVGEGSLALHEALLTFFQERLDWDKTPAVEATMFLTEWVHGHVLLAPSNDLLPDPAVMMSVDAARFPRAASALGLPPRGSAVDLPLRAIFGTPG